MPWFSGLRRGLVKKENVPSMIITKWCKRCYSRQPSLDLPLNGGRVVLSARSFCFPGGQLAASQSFRDAKREHVSWIPSCLQSCHEGTIHHSELMIETGCFMACCKAHNVGSTPQTKTWDATLFSVSGPQAAIVPSNPKPTRLRPKPRKYLGASGSSASWIWKTYSVKVGP